jgi:hypothetical protein
MERATVPAEQGRLQAVVRSPLPPHCLTQDGGEDAAQGAIGAAPHPEAGDRKRSPSLPPRGGRLRRPP